MSSVFLRSCGGLHSGSAIVFCVGSSELGVSSSRLVPTNSMEERLLFSFESCGSLFFRSCAHDLDKETGFHD